MGLKLTTPPAVEPVSLDDAKGQLRISSNNEDVLLSIWIKVARQYCEDYQNRAYITQTWDLSMDAFPDSPFVLPKPPLQSVTSIKYTDMNGVETEFDKANYQVDTASMKGRVSLAWGKSWPAVTLRPMSGVVVQFIAGYGDTAGKVPERVRQAILMIVGELYEHREVTDVQELTEVPFLGLDRIWPV